jgi:hypothetical protein
MTGADAHDVARAVIPSGDEWIEVAVQRITGVDVEGGDARAAVTRSRVSG